LIFLNIEAPRFGLDHYIECLDLCARIFMPCE